MDDTRKPEANRGGTSKSFGLRSRLGLGTLAFALLIGAILTGGLLHDSLAILTYFLILAFAGLSVLTILAPRIAFWTLLLTIVTAATFVMSWGAGITSVLAYAVLVSSPGFGLGILLWSPSSPLPERLVSAFVVGSLGTVFGLVIAVPLRLWFGPTVEVLPLAVAFVAVPFGIGAGAMCALGCFLGRILRGRRRTMAPAA